MLGSSSQEKGNHRLMITKMVLENFKSYAGEQEIGPFHKRFSSIVGPNGSGKSNVIDALLFVFGKRAKQLRLNKVSELIHKSSRFPSLEYAKVSVHFQLILDQEDSDDDYEVIPNSSFVVSRTAFQNNQSKYTVDGRGSTYTDVGLLLRKHGIDLDNNRFLILQGEVEQIAMMKPKALTPHEEGLLEYLEDIIGSNRFVEQIEEASKALDDITEQRVEKVNRLKIAEKERDNLSGSKLEAETYMEKDKEIRRKKNALYQLFEGTAKDNSATLTEKLDKATEKLTTEKSKLQDSDQRLSGIQTEYEKVKAEHSAVNEELQKSTTQYDAFERNDVKLQEDMKHAKTLIKKHQAAVAKETKKETDAMQEAEDILVQMNKYKQLISDFETKKVDEEGQLEQIMEGLQEATKDLRAQLETAQADLMTQEKSVSALQTEKESVETAVSLLQARSAGAMKLMTATQEKLAKLQADRTVSSERAAELQGALREEVAGKIATTETIVANCAQEEASLQGQVRDAMTRAEIGKAALAAQQSSKGSSVIVQRVLQAARKGGKLAAAGVRGRLGDLGVIDDSYDVAVSTACGLLDYIVVDHAEGGQACINFLREMNLGRASFIVLDQMHEWAERMKRPVKLPNAGSQRLFDLIDVQDKAILPAFYMALRDTLVTKDLDQAVATAYEGDRAVWRVVTLDGNLIDTSGAMSGGGKEVRSGGMKLSSMNPSSSSSYAANSKSAASASSGNAGKTSSTARDSPGSVTAEEVKQLEEMVTELQHSLTDCRAQKARAESQLRDLRKQMKDLNTELEKTRMALQRFDEQEKELNTRLQTHAAECELSDVERAELSVNQSRLEELEAEIATVSPNLRTMQTEVASLQRRILSVGGPKLAKVQSKIDSYTAQLDTFSSNLSTKGVEETNCRKLAEKAATARKKAEHECAKAETKLADLVTQQKEMETDALEVVNALEAAKERMIGLEEQLQASSKEYHDLKTLVQKIKTAELDLTVEKERIAKDLADSNAAAKKWHKEAEAVRMQHLDEQREFLSVVRSVLDANAVVGASSSADVPPPLPSAVCSGGGVGGSPMKVVDGDGTTADNESTAASSTKMLMVDEEGNEKEEMEGLEELPIFSVEEIQRLDSEELQRDISIMETQKEKMKNNVNMSALLDYMRKDASYKVRLAELEKITEARNAVRHTHENLRRQRLEAFMAGFGVISLKLKEMYQMITLGGDAELELLDSLDPFSEGIVFSVRPPRKSWKNISNLSGGEKTLSSLALVFALHHYKPTPLYVMDEIDAALDFKNVSIVANYIKDRTKDAQFVIISLRNNMFELADRLVGIYKTNDATKSVTINPKMFENVVTTGSTTAATGPAAVVEKKKETTTTSSNMSSAEIATNPLGDVTNTKEVH